MALHGKTFKILEEKNLNRAELYVWVKETAVQPGAEREIQDSKAGTFSLGKAS